MIYNFTGVVLYFIDEEHPNVSSSGIHLPARMVHLALQALRFLLAAPLEYVEHSVVLSSENSGGHVDVVANEILVTWLLLALIVCVKSVAGIVQVTAAR